MSDFVSDDVLEGIRKTLRIGQVEKCSIVSLKGGDDPWYKNFCVSTTGEMGEDNKVSRTVYRAGSLIKLLVAMSLHLIIEKLSKSSRPDHERYRRLHDWDEYFTIAFNLHRGAKTPMQPLRGNPTIRQLLTHKNACQM